MTLLLETYAHVLLHFCSTDSRAFRIGITHYQLVPMHIYAIDAIADVSNIVAFEAKRK